MSVATRKWSTHTNSISLHCFHNLWPLSTIPLDSHETKQVMFNGVTPLDWSWFESLSYTHGPAMQNMTQVILTSWFLFLASSSPLLGAICPACLQVGGQSFAIDVMWRVRKQRLDTRAIYHCLLFIFLSAVSFSLVSRAKQMKHCW